jgi:hypothetical protein
LGITSSFHREREASDRLFERLLGLIELGDDALALVAGAGEPPAGDRGAAAGEDATSSEQS